MKNSNKIYCALLVLSLIITACGGGSDADPDPTPPPILNPEKASLVFPNNNEECTGGTIVSNTQAKINFDWNVSANTKSYTLYLKNLDTDATQEFNATTDKHEITIERGVPYSWYVVSKSDKTTNTATSDTWKFYLAGVGTENYAPFPAELKIPANAVVVAGATVTLEWIGSDIDNDIKEYDVCLGTNANPTTKVSTVTAQKLENQAVSAATAYYWKIVTHDTKGNSSTSRVFSFTTN
jgi:hypothetical protein